MTVSQTTAHTTHTSTSTAHHNLHSQLLLRGTREGDLTATLSLSHPASSSPYFFSISTAKSQREPIFTWPNLLEIVSSGNLQKLSRHPEDLQEYFAWMDSIKSTYGSVSSFLLAERFTARKLLETASKQPMAPSEVGESRCFQRWFREGEECQILVNDWPYSVPKEVVHYVVWSYLPILHPNLVRNSGAGGFIEDLAWETISKRGLCGTISPKTGLAIPTLEHHKPHLPDLTSLLHDATTEEEEEEQLTVEKKVQNVLERACEELVQFIRQHWELGKVEAAFFANPPSLQSGPQLAHFHVLIKPLF